MPRPSKGARLYLQAARYTADGKLKEAASWVIRDGNIKRGTGFKEGEKALAEIALRDYLAGKPAVKTYYIYFLTARHEGFPIKIGITETRVDRFTSLQTALPYEVEVLAMIPVTDPIFERRLHRQFSHARLKGEWFIRTPDLMAAIESIREQHNGA
jgi:hypothetical protein